MLSESAIRTALREAPISGKSAIELRDDGPRGEGRLTLIIRVGAHRITPEWYVVWHRTGTRLKAKIGNYPTLGLGEARALFRETYAPAIFRGENPEGVIALRSPEEEQRTVQNLFACYVCHLEGDGKCSRSVRSYLLGTKNPSSGRWKGRKTRCAAEVIGPRKLACEVTHKDVRPYLVEIHRRGAVSSAAHARAYVSAAFTFAMASANSYHEEAGAIDWGVTINPVAAIPFDPKSKRVGQRHLSPAEFRDFWNWLSSPDRRSIAVHVLRLCMVTGQRLSEIIALTPAVVTRDSYREKSVRLGVYDPLDKTLEWATTKNKTPHTLPLPPQAVAILDVLPLNRHGLYFPHRRDPTRLLTVSALAQVVQKYLESHPTVPRFTPMDLRRTWKTLAGAAGLSKEIRDRLQNHAKGDVSSRHYDRYDYFLEKRAAMAQWCAYLDKILTGELANPVTNLRAAAA